MDINEIDDFNEEVMSDDNESQDNTGFEPIDVDSYPEDVDENGEMDYSEDDDEYEDTSEYADDVINRFLQAKGINPDAVKFETEDGYQEVPFSELSPEDQLSILKSTELDDDYGLDDTEINLINQLRTNNWSVEEYNNYIAQRALREYQASQETQDYSIDDISDDELYLLDLKSRIPDISQDDALSELNFAKQNQALYNRKVQGIRSEYKEREDVLNAQRDAEQRAKEDQQTQYFTNQIVSAIDNNSSIDIGDSAIELSTEDKNDIASFILDKDQAGVRYIAKALNDPNTLVNMVWYALKGKEAFRQISDYYKQQITNVAKRNYNKGYDDARGGRTSSTSKAVVRRSKNNTPKNRELTINDID